LKLQAEKKKFASTRKFKEAAACQNNIKNLDQEISNYTNFKKGYDNNLVSVKKEQTDKETEIASIREQIKSLNIEIEKDHQKFLMYRTSDQNDLLNVLRPFIDAEDNSASQSKKQKSITKLMQHSLSFEDAKKKKHALELDLGQMQEELLELELKYGPVTGLVAASDELSDEESNQEEGEELAKSMTLEEHEEINSDPVAQTEVVGEEI